MKPAPTPCLTTGCLNHATYMGRCDEHQTQAHNWANSTRQQRLPKDWATRRRIVLKRDKGICHICNTPGADAVDHIEQGDNHHLNNLAPIHHNNPPHCHYKKTAQEGNTAQAQNKPRPQTGYNPNPIHPNPPYTHNPNQ